MHAAGVRVAAGLPIGHPLLRPFLRPFQGRIDLRNHRKIVVIDGRITYCGSQNCASPEFLAKAKYVPWADTVIRLRRSNRSTEPVPFASDWMTCVDEDLDALLSGSLPSGTPGGVQTQVIGTGPTVRLSAMPGVFATLLFAARREVVIATPYFVPNDALHDALCKTAWWHRHRHRLSGPQRLLDCRGGQPQLGP